MTSTGTVKQNVVVVGGGGAGVAIAKGISHKLDATRYQLVVVNTRPFEIFYPPLVRAVVTAEGRIEDHVFTPLAKLFPGEGQVKVGTVAHIEHSGEKGHSGKIILESGEEIEFAVLVLTPGSKWEGALALPESREDVDKHLADWRAKFQAAKSVVLAGGGAVGIEIAGEIKDSYPNTKVTIVQGPRGLLHDSYPDKVRESIRSQLTSRGVDIILDDYIDSFPSAGYDKVRTRKGRDIIADLVVATRGGTPNTAFVNTLVPLTAQGRVPVESTLEVKGHPGVFAAGDAIDWEEQKQLAKVKNHEAVVVQNVLDRLAGREPSKRYAGSMELIIITNGKSQGIAFFNVLWGLLFGSWFARLFKTKDLLIGMHKKELGL